VDIAASKVGMDGLPRQLGVTGDREATILDYEAMEEGNVKAGIADTLTVGLSKRIRTAVGDMTGTGDATNYESGSYAAGRIVGTVVDVAINIALTVVPGTQGVAAVLWATMFGRSSSVFLSFDCSIPNTTQSNIEYWGRIPMNLDKELETYQRVLPSLLNDHEGEFVLIHVDQVDSFWKTEDDAYLAGCDRFGVEPFLVMPVQMDEKPLVLFHHVVPRCP
jgi:hypothetical protein